MIMKESSWLESEHNRLFLCSNVFLVHVTRIFFPKYLNRAVCIHEQRKSSFKEWLLNESEQCSLKRNLSSSSSSSNPPESIPGPSATIYSDHPSFLTSLLGCILCSYRAEEFIRERCLSSPAVTRMSCSPYLNDYWNGRHEALQLLICGVLLPEFAHVLWTSRDLKNGFKFLKRQEADDILQTMLHVDYSDDLALLANTLLQAKSIIHSHV